MLVVASPGATCGLKAPPPQRDPHPPLPAVLAQLHPVLPPPALLHAWQAAPAHACKARSWPHVRSAPALSLTRNPCGPLPIEAAADASPPAINAADGASLVPAASRAVAIASSAAGMTMALAAPASTTRVYSGRALPPRTTTSCCRGVEGARLGRGAQGGSTLRTQVGVAAGWQVEGRLTARLARPDPIQPSHALHDRATAPQHNPMWGRRHLYLRDDGAGA